MPLYSVKQVRASQNLANANRFSLVTRYVFVPIAWPISAVLASVGMGPNSVTVLRTLIMVTGLAAVCIPTPLALYCGIGAYFLFVIMDLVDGNLSRLLDKASFFGKMMDGFVDTLGIVLLPLALGVHMANRGDPAAFVAGAIAAISFSMMMNLAIRHGFVKKDVELLEAVSGTAKVPNDHPVVSRILSTRKSGAITRFIDQEVFIYLGYMRDIGLVIALLTDTVTGYLIILAALHTTLFIAFSGIRLLRSYVELDIHRHSVSAAARNINEPQ